MKRFLFLILTALLLAGPTLSLAAPHVTSDAQSPTITRRVSTLADLKLITGKTAIQAVRLMGGVAEGDGREGDFRWLAGDQSANPDLLLDTREGVFVKPTTPGDGSTGVWVRQYTGTIDGLWFGATPGTASGVDNGAIINSMVSFLDKNTLIYTGGGMELSRIGRYETTTPIEITSTDAAKLTSIKFTGQGMQNTSLVAVAGFPANRGVVEILDGTHCEISDLHLDANSLTDYGLWLKGQASGFGGYSHIKIERMRLQNAILDGYTSERGFLISLYDVFPTNNGRHGFGFQGYHTSTHVQQCYPANNGGSGFAIADMSYSTFIDCAADGNGQFAYSASNTLGVNFINCGAESTQRNAFSFVASAALDAVANRVILGINQTVLDGCFSFNNDLAGGGFGASIRTEQVDTSTLTLDVRNFAELTAPNGISVTSAGVTTDHIVRIEKSTFLGSINTVSGEYDPVSTMRVHNLSVTGLTDLADLATIFKTTDQYSGILHVVASFSELNTGSPSNTASYVMLVTKAPGGSGVTLIASGGLTSGAGASFPSFTFSLNTTTNKLQITPIASTSGNFYFYLTQFGSMSID